MIDITLLSHLGLGLVSLAVTGVLLFGDLSIVTRPWPRRTVIVFGCAWVAFLTAEFWILFPYSYVHFGDEGAQSFPYYLHLSRHGTNGRFDHNALGGTDAYALFSSGYQLLSFQRFLFDLFPSWAALGLHKVIGTSIAFASAYLLARRATGVPRELAAGIAATYTLSFQYMINVTLAHGFGHALMALGILVLCYRQQSPRYLLEGTVVALLIAVELLPVQGGLAFYPALAISACVSGAWKYVRFWAMVFVLVVLHIINWADTLYAMLTFGVLSSRVRIFAPNVDLSLQLEIAKALVPLLVTGASLVAAMGHPRARNRILVLLATPLLAAYALDCVPWNRISLEFAEGINFSYIFYALVPLSVMAAGFAGAALGGTSAGAAGAMLPRLSLQRGAIALLLAFPAGLAVHYKINNGLYWLGYAAQSNFVSVPNLLNPAWRSADATRVVAVPQQFSDNNLLPYGFEAAGGYFMLFDWRKAAYWQAMGQTSRSGRLSLKGPERHCPGVQDLSALGDPALMRVANVRYIVSFLPLVGGGTQQVSGPSAADFRPSCEIPAAEKIRRYLRNRFNPNSIYVYDLGDVVPRIFFARQAVVVPGVPGDDEYWHAVRRVGLNRGAVFEADTALGFEPGYAEASVVNWRRTSDGFEIDVQAPQGGLLIVNLSYLPYWKAAADGTALRIVPATGIHMAMAVPPKAAKVVLNYERWLPSDTVRSFFASVSTARN